MFIAQDAVVVLISADDAEAQAACRYLGDRAGMRFVAAMRGGMKNWKVCGLP